jgi:hypothetical protein
MIRRLIWCPAALMLSAVLLVSPTTSFAREGGERGNKLLEFDQMLTVTAPPQPFRLVQSGGAPWKITSGEGELKANGKLEVRVTGLLLLNNTNPFNPTNPVPASRGFSAQVTCAEATSNPAANSNVVGPFPTTATGNSRFETHVTLPSPCTDPVVLVGAIVNGTFRWFAMSVAEDDR